MTRFKEAPQNFTCPYRHHCPEMEGLSSFRIFGEYQRAQTRDHEHWRVRDQMAAEIAALETTIREQSEEIDRLRAENKRLHQSRFKPRGKNSKAREVASNGNAKGRPKTPTAAKKRGAPTGHPPDRLLPRMSTAGVRQIRGRAAQYCHFSH